MKTSITALGLAACLAYSADAASTVMTIGTSFHAFILTKKYNTYTSSTVVYRTIIPYYDGDCNYFVLRTVLVVLSAVCRTQQLEHSCFVPGASCANMKSRESQ